jgi:DNA-directed RNA polymerase specialized sigma24 family protein
LKAFKNRVQRVTLRQSPLTPDPLAVALLREMAAGRTTAEAASLCNVSRATAWRRLSDLREEWQVQNNVQLIVTAVRRGHV